MLQQITQGPFFSFLPTIFIVLGTLFCIFLFWRAARHELYESEFIFDLIIVAGAGGLIISRIFDFALDWPTYNWSLLKLVFFNAYGGFSFVGALAGIFLLGFYFIRKKRENFWQLADLAAAPIVLGMMLANLGVYLKARDRVSLVSLVCYFLIFWTLKRFETKKRHAGFFISFFLVSIALVSYINLLLAYLSNRLVVNYIEVGIVSVIFVAGSFLWYFLAKRTPRRDLKSFFAFLLLILLKLKRVITTIGEADNVAKSIIFSPLYLAQGLYFLVKLLGRESRETFRDLMHAFGVRR